MDFDLRNYRHILSESVTLPALTKHPAFGNFLEAGIYDEAGHKIGELTDVDKNTEGRVFVEFAGVNLIWGTFSRRLEPNEVGVLFFQNVPSALAVTPMYGEWDPVDGKPRLGEGIFELYAANRGNLNVRVVGRNTYHAKLHAAAGFIVSPDAAVPR